MCDSTDELEEIWDDDDDEHSQNENEANSSPVLYLIQAVVQALYLIQKKLSLSDSSLEYFLKLFHLFITLIAGYVENAFIVELKTSFPTSHHTSRKILGIQRDNFERYVVCPSCASLYNFNECITNTNGKPESRKCQNVLFPNHTQKSRRTPCGRLLLKTIRSFNGTDRLVPFKTYCCSSIKQSFMLLLKDKKFRDALLSKPTLSDPEFISDIYDGRKWKSFKDDIGINFFQDKRNIGFIQNLDWFNPYKILNLPRELRYKWEYTIVCGIIPGPKEPNLNINSFLEPIVNELKELWHGILLREPDNLVEVCFYRMALLVISSDIPATRKFAGFLGHMAFRGKKKLYCVSYSRFHNSKDGSEHYDQYM